MHTKADLEVITGTIQQLETRIAADVKRVINLKEIKRRIQAELNREEK